MMQRIHQFRLPIYAGRVIFVVCTDIVKTRSRYSATFGPYDASTCAALSCYDHKGKFAIFLKGHAVTHELVAHEIFHLTHRIMEYCGHEITEHHHEPHAYLCGFLSERLYAKLKQWKVVVK